MIVTDHKKFIADLQRSGEETPKGLTIGDLKKFISELEKTEGPADDIPLAITYESDNDIRFKTKVRFALCKEFVLIEAEEVPTPEDLTIMAAASLTAYGDELSDAEAATLRNFSMAAF